MTCSPLSPLIDIDPSDPNTRFTSVDGAVRATEAGDPVYTVLDKSQGLALGPNIAGENWQSRAGNVLDASLPGWAARATKAGSDGLAIACAVSGLTPGRVYRVTYKVTSSESPMLVFARIWSQASLGATGVAQVRPQPDGSVSFTHVAASETYYYGAFAAGADTDGWVQIEDVSVREIAGNHLTAPNNAARPLFQTDGTRQWLKFNGLSQILRVTIDTQLPADLSLITAAQHVERPGFVVTLARPTSSEEMFVARLRSSPGVGGWSRNEATSHDETSIGVLPINVGNDYVWAAQQRADGTIMAQHGTQTEQRVASATFVPVGGDVFSIGGTQDDTPYFSSNRIYGVQLFDRFLSDVDRATASAAMVERTGL